MDFQTAFQMIYNRMPTLTDYSANMYDQGQSIINQATALQNQVVDEGVMGANEPYQGTIQDTLFDSSRDYAESDFGKSVGAVPYTTDYVPTAVQQALDAVANQNVVENVDQVFEPVSNLTGAVSGLNFMPTNLTGQFYGMNPTTNTVGLMSNMASNPMFRSGVAGFTDTLPTGFEFGTPNVYRNITSYTPPQTFDEFVAEKEAEEAEAKKNRYTFSGMGADFDQSRLNETYTDP